MVTGYHSSMDYRLEKPEPKYSGARAVCECACGCTQDAEAEEFVERAEGFVCPGCFSLCPENKMIDTRQVTC